MEGDPFLMITCPTIVQIWQKDNYTFSIKWKDGKIQDFRLSDVQKICPCANCVDELTGKRLSGSEKVSEEVKATMIQSVGRYGIRIHFTSGCSTGIYPLNHLYRM
jgi:DUF971 family protein